MSNEFTDIGYRLGVVQDDHARLYFDTVINKMTNAGLAMNMQGVANLRKNLPDFFTFNKTLSFQITNGDAIFVLPEGLPRTFIGNIQMHSYLRPTGPIPGYEDTTQDSLSVYFYEPGLPKIGRYYQMSPPDAEDNRRYLRLYSVGESILYKKNPAYHIYTDFDQFAREYLAHLDNVRKEVNKFPSRLIKAKALTAKKNKAAGLEVEIADTVQEQ